MLKSSKAVIILASALCFLSFLDLAYGDPKFKVEGSVYCDTCRAQFITRVTQFMEGAKVRLECRDRAQGKVVYTVEGETDSNGLYSLQVEGEHEDEVCEIVLVKSSMPDCAEVANDSRTKNSARISLTENNGIVSQTRKANPLGFLRKEPLAKCAAIFKELGITPDELGISPNNL